MTPSPFFPRHATIPACPPSQRSEIIVLALLIAAALFLMYEIGKIIGEKRATDKFPEAKKAAVQRSRSVLSGMFAEQLSPLSPQLPL